jgi:hypothetical protein
MPGEESAMMAIRWTFQRIDSGPDPLRAWDALNAGTCNLPFLESGFLLPLCKHLVDDTPLIAFGHRGDRPVAAALVRRAGLGLAETLQPAQLPAGPWLVAPGEDGIALAQSLLSHLPGFVLGLGLTQLDPHFCARPDETRCVQTLDYIQTAWVDVVGSFDDYWEGRGKNLRINMRKQRAKLESEGVTLSFGTLTAAAEVPAAIAEYGRLETAGWKAGMGTAVHPDNAQGRFYTEMMQNFCAGGRGRIWQLKFGDKVVAMDLCIESGSTLVVLKTSYDPAYRNVSPAFLLRQDAFRQVFDEGRIRRIEFYGKVMEWHTRWTEQSRTLYHVNVYRWPFIPALRQQLRRLSARPVAEAAAADAAPGKA